MPELVEHLLCPMCGWTGQGVEASMCGACGSYATVGCGPVGWTVPDGPDDGDELDDSAGAFDS